MRNGVSAARGAALSLLICCSVSFCEGSASFTLRFDAGSRRPQVSPRILDDELALASPARIPLMAQCLLHHLVRCLHLSTSSFR